MVEDVTKNLIAEPSARAGQRLTDSQHARSLCCCPSEGATRPGGVNVNYKGKGSPYSITERRVPELIPVLGSQPAGDVNHKPDGRLTLLSARPAVTIATLKRAATNFAAW